MRFCLLVFIGEKAFSPRFQKWFFLFSPLLSNSYKKNPSYSHKKNAYSSSPSSTSSHSSS